MPDQSGPLPESKYFERPGARGFLVLLTAKTGNSALLKQRRIPFTVLETTEESLPFLDSLAIAVAQRILGKTVISITEKKVLSGKPWIARYGKPSVGEALTSLVGELFGAMPPSESVLIFSSLGRGWRLAGYRIGTLGVPDSARAGLERMLD